jgi:hypothetical protein
LIPITSLLKCTQTAYGGRRSTLEWRVMDEDVWMLEERLRLEGLNVYQDVLDPRASWLSRYRRVAGRRHLRHAKERTTLGSRAGEGVIVLGYTAEGHRQGAEPYRRFCTSTYRSGRLLREH